MQKDNDALLDYAEEAEEFKKTAETQIQDLTQKCQSLEREIQEKSTVLEHEKSKAEVYSQENEKLEQSWRKQQRDQEKELGTLTDQLSKTKDEKRALETLLEQMKTKTKMLESEIEKLKDQNDGISKRMGDTERAKGESEKAVEKLSLIFFLSRKPTKKKLGSKIEELNGALKTTKQDKENMACDQRKLKENIGQLEKQIKELDIINKKQKEELVQLTEENKTAEGKNNEYTETINYLTKNLSEAQNELEKILDAYEDLTGKHKKTEEDLADAKNVSHFLNEGGKKSRTQKIEV